MIKKFSSPQYQNMVRADVFLRVLLRFLSARRNRVLRGHFLAACGGENGSRYFKNRPHFRKLQARGSRLASFGGQNVFFLGLKNELAVSLGGKKIFLNSESNKTMRYVVYARKSTESEDRQVMSLESQLSELKEFAAKEKLKIVSVRGGAAHFCPATPEPRKAWRGNAVRAIFKIHRQLNRPYFTQQF